MSKNLCVKVGTSFAIGRWHARVLAVFTPTHHTILAACVVNPLVDTIASHAHI